MNNKVKQFKWKKSQTIANSLTAQPTESMSSCQITEIVREHKIENLPKKLDWTRRINGLNGSAG